MSKYNKLKIAMVAVGLTTMSAGTLAAQATGTILFGTITDVSVAQETATEFGDNYLLTAGPGINCSLALEDGSSGAFDGGNAAATLTALTTVRSGSACSLTPDSVVAAGGSFLVEGAATAVVNVIVTGATENDLLFEPAGLLVPGSFTELSNANLGGVTQAFADGVSETVTLTTGDDGFGNDLTVGYATIVVGGTLTAQNDLSAASTLSVNYTVEVTY